MVHHALAPSFGKKLRTAAVRVVPMPRMRGADQPTRRREFGEDPDFLPALPRLDLDALDWWPAVDPNQPIRYLPGGDDGRGPLAATLGGWLALLVTVLT